LLKRCVQRDGDAWAKIVDRFQNLVYSVARRYGHNDDDAADVFQATFQALLRNVDRIETAQTLPRWLAVTASRESLRIARISGKTVSAEDRGIDLDTIVEREEASAEENAVLAERADVVRLATERLEGRCRELLKLLYLQDDPPYAEISERLSIPIGAIGPTRARCLGKLRKLVEEAGIFE
jgi:RNA polymerase sigma factor (sigma-70 family)